MRFDLQRALPFLLLLFQGCGAGSLVPQLSITADAPSRKPATGSSPARTPSATR